MAEPVDLLLVNAAEVVTCARRGGVRRGPAQNDVNIVRDGAVAIRDGRFVAVGAAPRMRRDYQPRETIDARGGVVLPGFCDPHTHLVFAGERAAEWEQRMQGVPYLELLRRGGGILSTVSATRIASPAGLLAGAGRWLDLAVQHGTTTLEAKSGYCLDHDGELKLLEVVRSLQASSPIELVSTLLAAHVVPPEFADDRGGYIEVVRRLHSEVRRGQLAEFVDVFCEAEAFTLAETDDLLRHARSLGLSLKLHAEQFTASGATQLALALSATSVDHLEHVDDATITLLGTAAQPPVAVLLPGVPFHLAMDRHAPGRKLIDAGAPVAIATDLNPGSSFSPSMPMMVALACRTLGLTASEAIVAATINAAFAVNRGDVTGSIEAGKRADVIVCDVPDHRWLGYAFGWNPVREVIAGGRRVIRRDAA